MQNVVEKLKSVPIPQYCRLIDGTLDREAIQNHQTEAINAILREDQRPLFAAWRAERDRQRKLRDQQHKKQ